MRGSSWKRRAALWAAVIMMVGTLTACDSGEEKPSSGGTNPTAERVVELPQITVTNPTLKVLTHDAQTMEYANQTLADVYGITDVQITTVAPAEKRTRLINAVMSQDSFDIYWDDFAPALIAGGYVCPIEVDMSLALWDEVSASNEQYMWNGQRYYVVPGFARQAGVYYNKAMFDEAGETYPTELFDNGEWTWNKMLELAKTLTVDENRDGTPEQYGLGFDEPEHILYTTGKHFITFMPDGSARNNVQSPEVARAVAYNLSLKKSNTLVPANARENFGQGTVAMCIGHRWYAYGYARLIKAKELGFAPLPRDPDADKYYTAEEGGGYYIPRYCPNPEGALAAVNAIAYVIRSDKYKRAQYEMPIENGLWSEELQKEFEKNEKLDAGVLRNWESFNMGDYMSDVFTRPASGEPWETIAAELAPKIDAKIKEIYSQKSGQ